MKYFFTYFVFLVLTLLPTLTFSQISQDSLKSYRLSIDDLNFKGGWEETQITSASLFEEDASKAPAMVRVVTKEQIRLRGYRSLAELLEDLPEFQVAPLSTEQTNITVGVRGVEGSDRFIVLLDGVRISSPTNEKVPLIENYPLYLAKQVEVIYGASSVIYGTDAITAIINIITDHSTNKTTIEGQLVGGSFDYTYLSLNANVPISDDFKVVVGASLHKQNLPDFSKHYDDFDLNGLKTGTFDTKFGSITPQTPVSKYSNSISSYSIYTGVHYQGLQFSFFQNQAKNSSALSISPKNSIYNENTFFTSNIQNINLSHDYHYANWSFNSSLNYSKYEVSPESSYRNIYTNLEPGYKYALGSKTKAQQIVKWRISHKVKLLLGATYESFFSIPKTSDLTVPLDLSEPLKGTYLGTDIPMQFYTIRYQNLGGVIQLNLEPTPKIAINIAARLDKNSRFKAVWNPRISLNYQFAYNTFLQGLFSTAFLAPNPEYAYGHYGSFYSTDGGDTYKSFFMNLPNPNLRPLQTRNYEVGFKKIMLKNKLILNLHTYVMQLKDLYAFDSDADNLNIYGGKFLGWPIDYIETPINQGVQTNMGTTLQINYYFKKESFKAELSSALSYVGGTTQDKTGKKLEIGNTANVLWKNILDLYWKKLGVSLRGTYVSKQKQVEVDEKGNRVALPSYFLLNGSVSYKLFKNSYIRCDIQNMLDNRYTTGFSLDKTDTYKPFGAYQLPFRALLGVQIYL